MTYRGEMKRALKVLSLCAAMILSAGVASPAFAQLGTYGLTLSSTGKVFHNTGTFPDSFQIWQDRVLPVVQDNGTGNPAPSVSFSASGTAGSSIYTMGDTVSNFVFQSDVMFTNPPTSEGFYVNFRALDTLNYYSMKYGPYYGGLLGLYKNLSGGSTLIQQVSGLPSSASTWYNVELRATGNSLKVYFDHSLQIDQTDNALASGSSSFTFGICCSAANTWYLDNLKIFKSYQIGVDNLQPGQRVELYDGTNVLQDSGTVSGGQTKLALDVSNLSFPFTGYFKIYSPSSTLLYTSTPSTDIWGGDHYQFEIPGEYRSDANTVLLLHMNEVAGSLVADASGNGNNGTETGTTTVGGRFGNARSFDGTTGYIDLGAIPLVAGSGSFTIEAWALGSSSGTGYRTIFGNRWVATPASDILLDMQPNSQSRFTTEVSLVGGEAIGSILNDNAWHLWSGVVDVSAQTIRLYIDGVLQKETTYTIVNRQPGSNKWAIGGIFGPANAGPGSFWNGLIDEVRISNIARQPSEFNLQLPPLNLTATATGSSVALAWQNGGGAVPLLRYRIYRGTDSINVFLVDSTSAISRTIIAPTSGLYYYRVSAVDSTGFEGATGYAVSARQDGLVAWYPFNADANDSSGNGNNGTVNNGAAPTTDRFGKPSGAIFFDGTDDNISVPHSGLQNFTNQLTLSAWVKLPASGVEQYVISKGFEVPYTLGTRSGTFWFKAGSGTYVFLNSTTAPDGKWHCIAGVLDGANGILYVDGIAEAQTGFSSSVAVDAGPLTFGTRAQTPVTYLTGAVDDVRMYNRGLTQSEIQTLYKEGSWPPPGTPTNLISLGGNMQLTLKWNRNSEADLLRYRIYSGTSPNPTTKIDSTAGGNNNDTTKTIFGLSNGTPYYFRITAVDSGGNESGYSSEVTATPGAPPAIASFTPASGPIGTSVTITGTNFNTMANKNIVYFGAVKAAVNSASLTTLDVTVPSGTIFAPISVTDTATHLSAYSRLRFKVTFTTSPTINAGSFASKLDIGTGAGPYWGSLADFDGDGKPDVVMSGSTGQVLSIHRNTSASGTISFAARSDISFGGAPSDAKAFDMDGDGKLDVVVASENGNAISTFRNTSSVGNISFAAKFDSSTGTTPRRLDIGDLDGDGRPDVVAADNGSNTVSILRNTSSIGSISYATHIDYTVQSGPIGVALADIDGDGKLDIIVSNNGSGTISVFRNTSTAVTISLAPRIDFSTGSNPYGLAVADLDGDGKLEVVVPLQLSTNIIVLPNTSSAGSISFGTIVTLTGGSDTHEVAVGDFDGDGKVDLASTGWASQTVSVFRNMSSPGNLSFAGEVDFGTGTDPLAILVGDIDGDGKPDIAAVNNQNATSSISFFRNTTVLAVPTITSFAPTSGPNGTTVTITGTNFNTVLSKNIVHFGGAKTKVNSGSTTTLVVIVPVGAAFAPISVTDTTLGLTGSSNKPFVVTFPSSQIVDATSLGPRTDFTTGVNPQSLAIGDIDGDGKPDLAVTNVTGNTISIFRNTSNSGFISAGTFAPNVDFATGTGPYSLAVGDLDGDGKPDVVVTNTLNNTVSIFRNTAASGSITAGSLASRVDFTTGTHPLSVAIGDVDGDGKPDLVVANNNSNTISVFRNTSVLGSVTAESLAPRIDFTAGIEPQNVAVGDLDGDGKPDIVVSNINGNTISVFRNTSTPGSIASNSLDSKVDFTTGTNPNSIAIGDVDGDGKPDLVVTNQGSNTVSIFRNTSTSGAISAGSFASNVDFNAGGTPCVIAMGDVDGDGKPDFIVENNADNTVSVFRNTGTPGSITVGSIGPKVDFTTGTNPSSVALGDIDGDGKPDVAVSSYGSNTVSVLRNTVAVQTPQNLIASAGPTQVSLKWDKISENRFLRYRVYGGTSPNPSTKIDSTSGGNINDTIKVISGLSNGTLYYFRVTAIDSSGTASGYSNEVSVTPVGLVAWYPFNGEGNDSSGNGHNGVINGASATADRFGQTNRSLLFDGITNDVNIGVLGPIIDESVSLWFKKTVETNYPPNGTEKDLFGTQNSCNITFKVGFHTDQKDRIVFAIIDSGCAVVRYKSVYTNSPVTDTNWHHLVVTRSSSTMQIFVDNSLSATSVWAGSGNPTGPIVTNAATMIGLGGTVNPNSQFAGGIDDIRIYNRTLNVAEIDSLFHEGGWTGDFAPAAPQNLTITAGKTHVTLKWNQNTESDFLRYRIYGGTSPHPTSKIDSTSSGITDTTKVIGGLLSGEKYYFRVTAVDTAKTESGFSNEDSAVVLPSTPQNLVTASLSDTSVRLTWVSGGGKVAYYRILKDIDSLTLAVVDTTSLLQYTFTNLDPATRYYFKVVAVNSEEASGDSSTLAVAATLPPQVQNLIAISLDTTSVDLSWDPISGDIGSYNIYRGLTASSMVFYTSTAGAAFTDSALSPATTYYYWVSALNTFGGQGVASDYDSAATLPSRVRGVTAPTVDSLTITLHWNSVSGSPLRYHIYRGADSLTLSLVDSSVSNVRAVAGESPATQYSFRVAAVNVEGDEGEQSYAISSTTVPSIVRGLVATVLDPVTINLSWSANGGTIGVYNVYRGLDSSSLAFIKSVAGLAYSDTGLASATRFFYRVAATNTLGGEGQKSFASTEVTLPAQVKNLTATTIDSTSVSLNWSLNSGTIGDYEVFVGTDSNSVLFYAAGMLPPYTVTGLASGTQYYFRANARNEIFASGPLSYAAGAITLPARVRNLSALTIDTARISLSWNPATGLISRYWIFRGADSLTMTKIDSTPSISYTDPLLVSSTRYFYRVAAVLTNNGQGAQSYAATNVTVPAQVINLVVTPFDSSQIHLTWNAVPGTPKRYRIYSGLTPAVSLTDSTATTSYSGIGLSPSTQYYYQVSALNDSLVAGQLSALQSTTTYAATPLNLVATTLDTSQISISWNPGHNGAQSYRVYRGTSPGALAFIGGTASTTFVHTGLTPGVKYYFRVSALNINALESPQSQMDSAVTKPSTPRNLVASRVDTSTVFLSWQSGGGVVNQYFVYRGLDSTAMSKIDSTVVTNYTNVGLLPSTLYFYRISAQNIAKVEGTKGYADSAVTKASIVRNFTATTLDTNRIDISWLPGTPPGVSYNLYKGTDTLSMPFYANTASTLYHAVGLIPSTRYYFKIGSVDSIGEESALIGPTNAVTNAARPLGFSVAVGGSDRLTLSWVSGGGTNLRYRIYRSLDSLTFAVIDSTVLPTFTDSLRTPSTKYYYKVSALSAAIVEGQHSIIKSGTTNPAVPINLVVTSVDSSRITLSWLSGGGVNLYYRIYRSLDSLSFIFDTTNSLTFTEQSLSPSTKYYFKVSAFNSTGVEGTATAVMSQYTRPTTPRSVVATAIDTSTVSISWSSGGGPVTRFRVYRGIDSITVVLIDSTAGPSYNNTALLPSQKYYYRISAVNAVGAEGTRSYASVVITPPSFPKNLSAVALDTAHVKLTWAQSGGQDKYYKVRRSTDSLVFTAIDTTSLLTYTDDSLNSSTKYFYRLSTINTLDVESMLSPVVSAITSPVPPKNLHAVTFDSVSIDLSWLASGQAAYYRIYFSTNTIFSFLDTASLLTYRAKNLTPSTKYFFEVSAVNGLGVESQKTPQDSAVTKPAKPISLIASALDSSRINLSWVSGGGTNPKYGIYRSLDNISFALFDSSFSTAHVVQTLSPSVRYYFKVSAFNSVGVEGPQSISATDVTYPRTPRNLSAVGFSQTVIRLSWQSGGDSVTLYRIYSGPDSLSLVLLDSTVSTTYNHSGLAPSVIHAYKVSAVNFVGREGTRSNLASTSPVLVGEYLTDGSTALLMHFDETTGSLAGDASGNGNVGAATGTTIAGGRFGNGRKYTVYPENISVANSASLILGVADFTFESWVNTLGVPDPGGHIFHKRGTGGLGYYTNVNVGTGIMSITLWGIPSGPPSYGLSGHRSISDGRWHHVAFVRSGLTMTLFIDGVLDTVGVMGTSPNVDNDGILNIGLVSGGSTGDMFKGILDEVRISTLARSPAQFNLQRPPVNLTATDSSTTAKLGWQNGGGGIGLLRYRIYRGLDSTNLVLVDSTVGISRVNTGLSKGTRYFYRVAAVDSTGFESARSYAVSIRTRATQVATTLDPVPGEQTLSVGFSYHIPGIVADTLDIKGWYAFQGDTTFHPGTIQGVHPRLVNQNDVGVWLADLDITGRDTTVQFYLTVNAPDTSARSNTITIRTDMNSVPTSVVDNILSPKAGDITLTYHLFDREKDILRIAPQYSTNGGTTWKSPTQLVGQFSNIDSTKYNANFVWKSKIDVDTSAFVRFRALPFDRDTGVATAQSVDFQVLNNSIARIQFTPVAPLKSGDINVNYTLTDLTSALISLKPEYSLDGGATYRPLTKFVGDTSNIPPAKYNATFVWNSRLELPTIDSPRVAVRITPSNFLGAGVSDTTEVFTLDNKLPTFAGLDSALADSAQVRLVWTAGSDAHPPLKYFIYQSTIAGAPGVPVDSIISGTTRTIVGLTNFTRYYFRVFAQDLPGNRDTNKIVLSAMPAKLLRLDSLIAPHGRFRDSVYVRYILAAEPGDSIQFAAEFSPDGGLSWRPAKGVKTRTPKVTFPNYVDSLLWRTTVDTNSIESLTMKLRVTPTGRAATGAPKTSNTFEVDTRSPDFPLRIFLFTPSADTVFGKMTVGWADAFDISKPIVYKVFKSETQGVYNKSTFFDTTISDAVTFTGLQGSTRYYLKLWAIDALGNVDSTYADTSWMSALLCDFTSDGKINSDDLSKFVGYWREKNTKIGDIGPVTGTIPKVAPLRDGKIDIEDLTVFIQMWNWAFDNNKSSFVITQSLPKAFADSIAHAGDVRFPEESIIQPGESRSVALTTRGFNDYSVISFTLGYNPSNVRIDSVTLGGKLARMPNRPLLLKRTDEKRGLIHVAIAAFDDLQLEAKTAQQCVQVYVSPLKRVREEKIKGSYEIYAPNGTILQYGTVAITVSDRPKVPEAFALSQNYPNPFNPSTTIEYQLPVACKVTLTLYNLLGQEVAVLVNQELNAGYYDVRWSGSAASGVYFYVINAVSAVDNNQKFGSVKKMLRLH